MCISIELFLSNFHHKHRNVKYQSSPNRRLRRRELATKALTKDLLSLGSKDGLPWGRTKSCDPWNSLIGHLFVVFWKGKIRVQGQVQFFFRGSQFIQVVFLCATLKTCQYTEPLMLGHQKIQTEWRRQFQIPPSRSPGSPRSETPGAPRIHPKNMRFLLEDHIISKKLPKFWFCQAFDAVFFFGGEISCTTNRSLRVCTRKTTMVGTTFQG